MSIDFAAIDFETANSERSSPCALGFVIVRNGKIVDERNLLMRPPNSTGPEDFDDFNIGLHGIGWEQVKNEPFFSEIWESLVPVIGDLPLVAHNAPFDINVLADSIYESDMGKQEELLFTCTLQISRQLLNLVSYSLPYVAAELNVECRKHHDALSDARTAANIMIELCHRSSCLTLDDLLESTRRRWGKLDQYLEYSGSTRRQRSQRDLPPPRTEADKDHFLYGKHVVITGTLPGGIVRRQAQDRIAHYGGISQMNITSKTSLLVVGDLDPLSLAPGATISSKMKKAQQLRSEGAAIEIIAGYDFLPLLD